MGFVWTMRAPGWLARGINVGGLFDRRDGDAARWAERDRELRLIVEAGFTHVRVPVRWWGHADHQWPWALEETFADEVDCVLESASAFGLGVVLSMHHADGVMTGEPGAESRLCGLWRQVASRYRSAPPTVAYDLLNEPRGVLTGGRWNQLLRAVLEAVREVDPVRTVVAGGADMSTLTGLLGLKTPLDQHLVATMHYYEPFRFTHQGAWWENGSAAWNGTRWGSACERRLISEHLETAASWAGRCGLPLYIGEFGTYQAADHASRIAWTRWVRSEADRLGLAWAYWDFRTGFGVYDPKRSCWRSQLLETLMRPGEDR
jgi:endoglucanase